jgi:hypothetical protein
MHFKVESAFLKATYTSQLNFKDRPSYLRHLWRFNLTRSIRARGMLLFTGTNPFIRHPWRSGISTIHVQKSPNFR